MDIERETEGQREGGREEGREGGWVERHDEEEGEGTFTGVLNKVMCEVGLWCRQVWVCCGPKLINESGDEGQVSRTGPECSMT